MSNESPSSDTADSIEDTGELEPVKPNDANGDSGDFSQAPPPEAPLQGGSLTAVVIHGILGLAVLILVAAEPWAITALEEIVGLVLIVFALFEGFNLVRNRNDREATTTQQRVMPYVQPIAALVAGVALVIWPQETLEIAGYFLAGVFIIRGALDLWAAIRRWHEQGANSWVFVRGLIAIALGALIALFPAQSVAVIVVGGALLFVLRAILGVWFSVTNRDAHATLNPGDTYGILTYWLSRREMDSVDASEVENRVFIHKRNRKERLWRFAILMFLATTIATFGIAQDSTAVVIGAMLVAPLMTPILGTAAGLINGRSKSTAASALITACGAAGAIVLAWALAAAIPDLQAVVQNGQVTSRTSPNLMDLAIALAAGAAGAYGVSRAESTDALPGVAVAIALVPPLAVVGLTLHAGEFSDAGGALLLFLTNLFSILLMAGVVFVLVGYGSWGRLYHRRNRIRVSFAAVAFAVVLISIPLALTARNIIQRSTDLRTATDAVVEWLGDDTRLRIESVELDKDIVLVQLVGPDQPPPTQTLANSIAKDVGRQVTATVRWVEEAESSSTAGSN